MPGVVEERRARGRGEHREKTLPFAPSGRPRESARGPENRGRGGREEQPRKPRARVKHALNEGRDNGAQAEEEVVRRPEYCPCRRDRVPRDEVPRGGARGLEPVLVRPELLPAPEDEHGPQREGDRQHERGCSPPARPW